MQGNTTIIISYNMCRIPMVVRSRRGSAVARLLELRVRIPPRAWIFVLCKCGVLSGRGLYLQRSPTDVGVSKCHRVVLKIKMPRPTSGCRTKEERKKIYMKFVKNKKRIIVVY